MSNPYTKIPSFQRSTKASRARSPEKPAVRSPQPQPGTADTTSSSLDQPFLTSSLENTSSEASPIDTPSLPEEQGTKQTFTGGTGKLIEANTPKPKPFIEKEMGQTKIRAFRGLRDGKEDPNEYLEDIEWAYEQDYQSREPDAAEARTQYSNKTHRILFRQNLEDEAFTWYSDLDGEIKQDWERLRDAFLPAYTITAKDTQTKKFELRVKLANLQQEDNENIADYLKRAGDLHQKLPQEYIDVGMATLRGMHDGERRGRVSFECNKNADYSYPNVLKLIKAAYSEIGKANPFDPGYKDSLKLTLPGAPQMSNEELMRQVLINTNQAFPALVQGMRNLQTTFAQRPVRQTNPLQIEGKPYQGRPADQSRPKKDISDIECSICGQKGHYASYHNQANPPAVTAGVMPTGQNQQEYEQEEDSESEKPVASRCLVVDDDPTHAMEAAQQRNKAGQFKTPQVLQRPKGIQKSQPKGKDFTPPQSPQHILDQIREFNENYANNPGASDANVELEEMDTDEDEPTQTVRNTPVRNIPDQRSSQPAKGNMQEPPQARVTKTGKVQELVAQRGPKVPDPIRGMTSSSRTPHSRSPVGNAYLWHDPGSDFWHQNSGRKNWRKGFGSSLTYQNMMNSVST